MQIIIKKIVQVFMWGKKCWKVFNEIQEFKNEFIFWELKKALIKDLRFYAFLELSEFPLVN